MVTILSENRLDAFKERFAYQEAIIIPIFVDPSAHPCDNVLSLLYVHFLDNGDEVVVPFNHSEALNFPWSFEWKSYKFVPNRKELLHVMNVPNLVDVNLLQYVSSGQSATFKFEDTKAHTLIKRNYPKTFSSVNRIIPITKWVESCRVLSSKMQQIIDSYRNNLAEPSFEFLNNSATNVFSRIESSGVFTTNGYLYSEYNFFTSTGRPSNRYGGVNFAALNKEDGTRKGFVSRFLDDGMLVLVDYDAYHLRLIADLIGFKFPPGNVHDYLGTMYFKTDALTEEQYNESKRISFHMLYGGITDEYKSVPFFLEVQKFIDYLWSDFRNKGYIISPIGQRKLFRQNMGEMHPQKLFNYFIQLHETEQNIMTLERVLPMFDGKQSQIVLYTYDSFLIDFKVSEGIEFIRQVKTALECENSYPTKVYVGANYHSMDNVTDRFQ